MNAARRKELSKAIDLIEQAKEIISAVAEEEREAYENLPEGLQESEMGEKMNEIADDLEYVDLDEVVDTIQEIIER
ncbi:MAG: hypothetical protein PUC53_01825 [Bacteroidales bacterium]|nr:hypothetical protein [Bacteroidales bacterium]